MRALQEYTSADREVAKCPFDYYAAMRTQDPVHKDPVSGWYFITRYEDAKAAAQDPATFSSSTQLVFRTVFKPAAQRVLDEAGITVVNTFTSSDPPEALNIHNVGTHLFPPKKVNELLPQLAEIANSLIDGFIDGGEVQIGREYGRRLIGTVIAGQLGLPLADLDRFKYWADCTSELMKIGITEEEEVNSVKKMVELMRYLQPHVDRAKLPDMMGTAIHEIATMNKKDGTPFTHNQRCWMAFIAFTGANNTTVNMLNTIMFRLATNTKLQEELRSEPEKIAKFVEEMLRLEGSTQSLVRKTTRDVEVGGTLIPKGSHVLIAIGSANRDERRWGQDADKIRLDREEGRAHLSFGAGLHVCIGMHLARAELRTAVATLLKRTKHFGLKDPTNPPEFLPLPYNRAIADLELRFEKSA